MPLPEPWLRGPLEGVHPHVAPVLRSLEMAWEDLQAAAGELSERELWARPGGAAPVGFHLRHICGSIDRLLTYAEGVPLSEGQMQYLRDELRPGASASELLEEVRVCLDFAARRVRAIPANSLGEPRGVGRKHLPSTVIGLLVHTAEHTQRHVGQVVTTARIVRALHGRGDFSVEGPGESI